jgi:hypothetical protein
MGAEEDLADRLFRDMAGRHELLAKYDLVTIFEGLHDIARPIDALRVARGMLRGSGCVIVAAAIGAVMRPATRRECCACTS